MRGKVAAACQWVWGHRKLRGPAVLLWDHAVVLHRQRRRHVGPLLPGLAFKAGFSEVPWFLPEKSS